MDTIRAQVTVGENMYTAVVEPDEDRGFDGAAVTIYNGDVWAGEGRWSCAGVATPIHGMIVDCGANLGDEAWDALDEAVSDAIYEAV